MRPEELQEVMGSNKRARYFYYFWQTECVSEIYIHPKYNETGESRFDVALIRLENNQELERNKLWPVCLPSSSVDSYAENSVTVIGWMGETFKRRGKIISQDIAEARGQSDQPGDLSESEGGHHNWRT